MLDNLIWLALALTVFAWVARFIVVSLAASAVWLAYTTYVFIVMPVPVDVSTTSGGFLLGGLLLMVFVPLLFQMRTDIRSESRNRRGNTMGKGGIPQGKYGEITEISTTSKWKSGDPKRLTSEERQYDYRRTLRSTRRR